MGLHPDFLRLPIAHRGLHSAGVPENSMAAFRAAIAAGYGIECDIQAASDGTPVVFHDDDLPRLTGADGLVRALGMDALSMLRIMGTDEPIPTLTALLAEVAGQVPLLIEIKDQSLRSADEVGDLSERVAAQLADYPGRVAVMSFNPHSVAGLRKAIPDIAVGLTTCAYDEADWPDLDARTRSELAAISDFDRVGASFISHDRTDLENPAVAALRARGVPVLSWTIRSPAEEALARRVADNITFENYLPGGA
ncbi:glycerophosphodiester phosphodiesterase family protein [Paracoccus ravus]|uniref:glycerophosphodiester phosphodiesterase family protein n=1 Tax=Paracoccus ravus TaxID=2447760 RepID=UPI00106E8330|nr:glycerophosphodiester phosphodiesterase family protein [Paracoccus ravus]